MQDDNSDIMMAPRSRRSGGRFLFVALLAFVLGAGLAGWLAWHGDLDRVLPRRAGNAIPLASADRSPGTPDSRAVDTVAVGAMETRLALLEDRFSRIDFAADAAAGNAARAEALLIALSARRLIDRGEPLGYVSDQLRLRFADAQPKAVDTILAFASEPVTIDQLGSRLEALSPDLANSSADLSLWERMRQELGGLFVVRRDSSTLLAPTARIQRARLMLTAGRIGDAIDEIGRLPGADHADKWMQDAHRYDDAQRALDLIETTAMIEPRKLKDGAGRAVDEPSPVAAPAEVVPGPVGGDDATDGTLE